MKIYLLAFSLSSIFFIYGMESEMSKEKGCTRRRFFQKASFVAVGTQTSGVDNFIARWEGEARSKGTWSPALWDLKMRDFRLRHEKTMRELLKCEDDLEIRIRLLRENIPDTRDASEGCCMMGASEETQTDNCFFSCVDSVIQDVDQETRLRIKTSIPTEGLGAWPSPISLPVRGMPSVARRAVFFQKARMAESVELNPSFFNGKNFCAMAACFALGFALRSLLSSHSHNAE
jgi:hypothetical protein